MHPAVPRRDAMRRDVRPTRHHTELETYPAGPAVVRWAECQLVLNAAFASGRMMAHVAALCVPPDDLTEAEAEAAGSAASRPTRRSR